MEKLILKVAEYILMFSIVAAMNYLFFSDKLIIVHKSQYECQGRDVTPEGVRCLAYVSKSVEEK